MGVVKREHLYKGKCKETTEAYEEGQWINGYLACFDLICPGFPEETTNATGEYYGQIPYVGFIEVDSESVCQYVDKEDKNGRKIWENDIVRFLCNGNQCIGQIVWSDEVCGFIIAKQDTYVEIKNCEEIEVIGNIIDDPELVTDRSDASA